MRSNHIGIVLLCGGLRCTQCNLRSRHQPLFYDKVINTLKDQILKEAAWAMQQLPITVTAATSPRSAGGKHDFYSEGDYWWPNPAERR